MSRLSKTELKNIIREVIDEVNSFHDPKTGKFSSGKSGDVYSLTANAKDNETAKNKEVPARGSVTSKGKVSSKYGANTGSPDKQCGRLTIKGDKKTKTRSCSQYPKKYSELTEEDLQNYDSLYLQAVIKREVEAALNRKIRKLRQQRAKQPDAGCSWNDILRGVSALEKAQKGELN